MRRRWAAKGGRPTRLGAFMEEDTSYVPKVRRQHVAVWDVVSEQSEIAKWRLSLPSVSWPRSTKYLKRLLQDLWRISPVWLLLWVFGNALNSFIPAASIYYSSQLLRNIQKAVEGGGNVAEQELLWTAFARLACTVLGRLLTYLIDTICAARLNVKIRSFFEEHLLYAHVRLDNVTFNDPKVQHELTMVSPTTYSSAWRAVSESIRVASVIAQLFSELSVLATMLRRQNEGILYFALTVAGPALQWISRKGGLHWATSYYARTQDEDYLRFLGYRDLAYNPMYREEIVMYNLQSYIMKQARELKRRLRDNAVSFHEALRLLQGQTISGLLGQITAEICRDLPQILFALRSLETPSLSLSLTWLALLRETVASISNNIINLSTTSQSLEEHFECIRILYSCAEITNQIPDGVIPYARVASDADGMSLEFRDVKFKYPNSSKPALAGVSFKIEPGQLCVIVGRNGSGKSSLIRLISRLYDCTEGAILVDDEPIQHLQLASYRRCISTLPQEFTFFPLTVGENIGLGDPEDAEDEERIRKAASLGGALEFIEKDLPEGFGTRLKGPRTFQIHTTDQRFAQWANREVPNHSTDLSGGQWQKLALSRTFMRSSDVSRLLCYDEPSASLDPLAEYDLFQRLRELRGKKTMVFVTHRFGHLTRGADKIIVLDDGHVLEQGTHDELLAKNGQYAKMYRLQAMAFSAI